MSVLEQAVHKCNPCLCCAGSRGRGPNPKPAQAGGQLHGAAETNNEVGAKHKLDAALQSLKGSPGYRTLTWPKTRHDLTPLHELLPPCRIPFMSLEGTHQEPKADTLPTPLCLSHTSQLQVDCPESPLPDGSLRVSVGLSAGLWHRMWHKQVLRVYLPGAHRTGCKLGNERIR